MVMLVLGALMIVLFIPLRSSIRMTLAGVTDLSSRAPTSGLWRRHYPVEVLAEAISRCADVYKASHRRRGDALLRLAWAIAASERLILRMHRMSTAGRLTRRSAELRRHGRMVVAALREAEGRIDRDGPESAKDLAQMLLKVADRYTERRVGAMLDEDELAGLTPAHDWELLRMAAAALLIPSLVVVVGVFSELPEGTDIYVYGGGAIVILVLLYGRGVGRVLHLIDVIRGP
ncbi:hypothetical protein [Streptomyces sp. NPDC055099]